MKTSELSQYLGLPTQTIRRWVATYGLFFSPEAKGEVRHPATFTPADIITLATIYYLSEMNYGLSQIDERLRENYRVDSPEVALNYVLEKRGGKVVPPPREPIKNYVNKEDLSRTRAELEQNRQELASMQAKLEALYQQNADLQYKLGAAEAKNQLLEQLLQNQLKNPST